MDARETWIRLADELEPDLQARQTAGVLVIKQALDSMPASELFGVMPERVRFSDRDVEGFRFFLKRMPAARIAVWFEPGLLGQGKSGLRMLKQIPRAEPEDVPLRWDPVARAWFGVSGEASADALVTRIAAALKAIAALH